jgi:pyruvate formate lyase activating enzyme
VEPARFWIVKDKEKNEVQCLLCPHVCRIAEGGTGLCRVRYNQKGELKVGNYGKVTAAALDPIEKKPLKKYLPGKMIFSLGTFGCSLSCGFCQNWRIAHGEDPPYVYMPPQEAVKRALQLLDCDNAGIAYTYSEPLMWYEYVFDTARLAREAGLKNVLVTNGYINPKPLKELLVYIDAVNLDVKSFGDEFYRDVCQGRLKPVLESAKLFAGRCHLEITTLLVPGLNDSPGEIRELARWIAGIDRDIPLHLTRYFPNYKFNLPATPLETMRLAKKEAEKFLTNVFLGNV